MCYSEYLNEKETCEEIAYIMSKNETQNYFINEKYKNLSCGQLW